MSDDSLLEALAFYEKKGYSGQFGALANAMVQCHSCHTAAPAAQVPVEGMHRFEGSSDPSDEALLCAMECPNCGKWGTISLSYGPESSSEDAAVLSEMMDARDMGPIPVGQ